MTNYVRINENFHVSDQSDYNDDHNHTVEQTDSTTTQFEVGRVVSVGTTAETLVAASSYSSIEAVLIENKDAANAVIVEFDSKLGAITFTAGDLAWAVGPPGTLTIIAGTEDWTVSGFTAPCYVVVSGADEAANNDTWDIQAVSAAALTMFEAEVPTADPADTGVAPIVTAYKKSALRIAAGKSARINAAYAGANITARAETAACSVKFSVCGVAA